MILTIDYQDTGDIVIKYIWGGEMPGADYHIRVTSNVSTSYVHANSIAYEYSWEDIIKIIETFLSQQ